MLPNEVLDESLPSPDAMRRMQQEVEDKKQREAADKAPTTANQMGRRLFAKGGSVSASRRGDGIAQRGKTKGRMV